MGADVAAVGRVGVAWGALKAARACASLLWALWARMSPLWVVWASVSRGRSKWRSGNLGTWESVSPLLPDWLCVLILVPVRVSCQVVGFLDPFSPTFRRIRSGEGANAFPKGEGAIFQYGRPSENWISCFLLLLLLRSNVSKT